jgi:hypothetical protein
MKRKLLIGLPVACALVYGIVMFALPHSGATPVSAAAPVAATNVVDKKVEKTAEYRVGDRLPATEAAPKSAEKKAPQPFEEISWFALVPKGWDPMKEFSKNMSNLSDADPRAMEALDKLRKEWDNAPVEPSMQNARIRIAGFVVPLESDHGQVKEFLLVPYFGACIHTPPPPANQIIHVFPKKPVKNMQTMDAMWVSGTMKIARSRTSDNTMGLVGSVGYEMTADIVDPYKDNVQK